MALQIWTPDQVPNLMVAGKTALGRGIGGGISAAGDAIKEFKERDKREADEAKRERALAKMFKDELGLSDADVERLDAHTLRGMNEGYLLKNSQAHQAALTELSKANTKLEQQRMAFEALREQQGQAAARVPGQILDQAAAGIPGAGVLRPEAFDEELAKRTGMSPGALSLIRGFNAAGAPLPQSVLDDLIRNGGTGTAFNVKELGVPRPSAKGKLFVPTSVHGGQLVEDFDAFGPGTLRMATDEEGNEIPGVAIDAKGKPFQLKGKATRKPGEGPTLSKDGKFYWDDNSQAWKPIHSDLSDAFQQILQGGGGGAKPAATAPAAPALRFRKNAKGEIEQY